MRFYRDERFVIDQGNSATCGDVAQRFVQGLNIDLAVVVVAGQARRKRQIDGTESLVPSLVTVPFRLSTPRADAGGI